MLQKRKFRIVSVIALICWLCFFLTEVKAQTNINFIVQKDSTESATLDDVEKALNLALTHLQKSTDIITYDLVYRTPATSLRQAANAIEQKDEDIEYIKRIFNVIKKHNERMKKQGKK